jgi:DNA-binding protein YbaB
MGFGNPAKMMAQLQKMQADMARVQAELATT